MNVRLIIPDLKDEAYFRNAYIQDKLETIASIAGGYTSYRGHGGWIDSKGLLVEEPVTIVDVSIEDNYCEGYKQDGSHGCPGKSCFTFCPSKVGQFRRLARTVARELSQECVFLSIAGNAELIRP
jgi:hypothetical protein